MPFWQQLMLATVPTLIAVVVMLRHNRQQLESVNKNHREESQLRLEEIKAELNARELEREIAVGQVILPKCLEVMQLAFKHTMTINLLLDTASVVLLLDKTGNSVKLTQEGEKLNQAVKDIRAWYDENCFYLPTYLQGPFVGLLNQLHAHFIHLSAERDTEVRDVTWRKFFGVSESLKDSIEQFMSKYSIIEKAFGESEKNSDSLNSQ